MRSLCQRRLVRLLPARWPLYIAEQNGLDDLLPLAERQGFSLLLGGPFNSGILATGATPGAKYNYKPAPTEIVERVKRIDAICERYEVPLAAAAIQFPLGHPNVASIIPGAVNVAEAERNTDYIKLPNSPRALWDELKAQNLLAADVPVPMPAD